MLNTVDTADPSTMTTRTKTRKPAPRQAAAATPSGLGTASIVEAAQRLIAESHTDQLTMRRLSDRLGVALGATYHYVKDRDTLLKLVAERINGEITLASTNPRDWATTVRTLMIDYARAYGRHPGMASFVNNNLGSMPPDATQLGLLELLIKAGFDDEHARTVLAALFFYASGATASELMYRDHELVSAAQLIRRFEQGLDIVIEGAKAVLRDDRRARRTSNGH